MFFFVVIANKKEDSTISYLLIKTITLYLIFIGISITDNKYTLLLIVIIFAVFLINIYITKYLKNTSNEKEKDIKKLLIKINKYLLRLFIFGLVYAILLQYSKKKIQHGKNFSLFKFFVRTPSCNFSYNHNPGNMSELNYIKAIFK